MRLLDTTNGQFVEVTNPSGIEYAILSHTWDPEGEQSYQDVRRLQELFRRRSKASSFRHTSLSIWLSKVRRDDTAKLAHGLPQAHLGTSPSSETQPPRPLSKSFLSSAELSVKIRQSCAIACANGHRLLWIDSCCIDKTSSSELSEAINSMCAWYRSASVCYAYLADVPCASDPRADSSTFRRSRWFHRGWTLQELIAPRLVVFLSLDWKVLGTKSSLATTVEDVTGIDRRVLMHRMQPREISVAERMSWAAGRETTRVEDQAYALLGIFDINMPTLYGEGPRAFARLQEEIMNRIPDQSLFAWGRLHPGLNAFHANRPLQSFRATKSALVAESPYEFWCSRSVRALPHDEYLRRVGFGPEVAPPTNTLTPYGLYTQLPVIPVKMCFPSVVVESARERFLVLLACETTDPSFTPHPHVLAMLCSIDNDPGTGHSLLRRVAFHTASFFGPSLRAIRSHNLPYDLIALSASQLATCRAHVRFEALYAPTPSSSLVSDLDWVSSSGATVHPAPWTTNVLRELGYTLVIDTEKTSDDIRFECLRLFNTVHNIRFTYPSPRSIDSGDDQLPVWIATGTSPCTPIVRKRHGSEPPDGHANGVPTSEFDETHEANPFIRPPPGWEPERAHYTSLDPRKPVEMTLPVSSGGLVSVRLTLLPYKSRMWYMDVEISPDEVEETGHGDDVSDEENSPPL